MLGHGVAQLAVGAARLARRYPLESIAVVLLGVGGLIFPFPFWLLGGLLAIWSRVWQHPRQMDRARWTCCLSRWRAR